VVVRVTLESKGEGGRAEVGLGMAIAFVTDLPFSSPTTISGFGSQITSWPKLSSPPRSSGTRSLSELDPEVPHAFQLLKNLRHVDS